MWLVPVWFLIVQVILLKVMSLLLKCMTRSKGMMNSDKPLTKYLSINIFVKEGITSPGMTRNRLARIINTKF